MHHFKFKAWDKVNQVQGHIESIDYDQQEAIIYKPKKFFFTRPLNHLTLCLGSGLKDQNGDEIYQGDIIKFSIPNTKPGTNGQWNHRQVIYEDGAFWVDQNEQSNTLLKEYLQNWHCKINGNIFETPERLVASTTHKLN